VVIPDDNVELTPRTDEFQGLLAEHVLPRIELPVRQQEPLVYRGDPGPARFIGDVRVLSQSIEVDAVSTVLLEQELCNIEQKFAYRVDYEPVDHVNLVIPAGLPEGYKPEVSFDGQLLDDTSLILQSDSVEEADTPAKLRVRLPAPAHFGRFEILVRFSQPMHELSSKEASALNLPLFMPDSGVQGDNAIDIVPTSDIRVVSISKPWQAIEEDDLATRPGVRVAATGRPTSLQLAIEAEKHSTPGTTLIALRRVKIISTFNCRQAFLQVQCRYCSMDFRLRRR
jgi:hypothetical protein